MKLLIQPRAYSKPRIKISVGAHATKLKVPLHCTGAFADRLNAFAVKIIVECTKVSGGKTMRGTVGLDENTGHMHVVMRVDKKVLGDCPNRPGMEIQEDTQ